MTHARSFSVRRRDIFISHIGLALASGDVLPAGTAFVCKRGGHQAQLVFQHPIRGDLAMVTMGKQRICEEMRRGVRQQLPIRLAAASGYPIDHIPRVRPIAGRSYLLTLPMPALNGGMLPVGTLLQYQPMNGLHVFNIMGSISNGFPARLVFGDDDLRAIAPNSTGFSSSMEAA